MCQSMVDIQSATAEIRRGIKKDKKIETTGKNIISASATQGGHKNNNTYTNIMTSNSGLANAQPSN